MHYFSRQEITNRIRDNLDNYDEHQTIAELFDDLFNSDFYIVGTYEANQMLESGWEADWQGLLGHYSVDLPGTFGALQLVINYDEKMVGINDINIEKLLNPEYIANKLEYILSASLMDELLVTKGLDYESRLTDDVKKLLVK